MLSEGLVESRHIPRWLLPVGLILIGLGVVLVGSYAIATTRLGIAIIAGIIAILMTIWITTRPNIGLYVLTAFIYLNLSDILEVQFGIPSINKVLIGLVF